MVGAFIEDARVSERLVLGTWQPTVGGLYRLGVFHAHLFPERDAVSAAIVWEVTGELDGLADDVVKAPS